MDIIQTRILVLIGATIFFTAEFIVIGAINRKPGYVITTKCDTIYATLRRYNQDNVDYKSKIEVKYHHADIDSIKEYVITKNNQHFKAMVMPDKITPVYLHQVDSGKIDVYEYFEHVGKSYHLHMYASKNHQPLIKIYGYNGNNDNKKQLDNLISDDKPAQDYLAAAKLYNNKVAIGTIKLYNINSKK